MHITSLRLPYSIHHLRRTFLPSSLLLNSTSTSTLCRVELTLNETLFWAQARERAIVGSYQRGSPSLSSQPKPQLRHQSQHLINTFPSHLEPLNFGFSSSKSRCPALPDYLTELSFSCICYEPRRVHTTTTSISTLLAALPFGHRQPQAPPVAQVKTPSHHGPGGTWNNDTSRVHQGHTL
jgi:hypothetical protein